MKVAVFNLLDQEYILRIDQLQEIVRAGRITRLPKGPDYLAGTIKRRGRVVPIIDLRRRLSLPPKEIDVDTCIFIIRQDDGYLGLLVDAASEIIEVPDDLIESPEPTGIKLSKFIEGVAYLDKRFLILLNLGEILSPETIRAAA